MDKNEFRKRTKKFALDAVQFVKGIPRSRENDLIARQLFRSATSVGANYRAACSAKSMPDFINKVYIVEEEADESRFWLELLKESGIIAGEKTDILEKEAGEIYAMCVASIKTARSKNVRMKNKG